MGGYNLTFNSLKIKRSRASEGNDQAYFLLIKNLNLGHKLFNRQHISDHLLKILDTRGLLYNRQTLSIPFLEEISDMEQKRSCLQDTHTEYHVYVKFV